MNGMKKINQRLFKRLILYYNVEEGNLRKAGRNPPYCSYPTTGPALLSIENHHWNAEKWSTL